VHIKVPDDTDICKGIHLPVVVISIQSHRRLQHKAKRAKLYFPREYVTAKDTGTRISSVNEHCGE